jgi:hypothetical protein
MRARHGSTSVTRLRPGKQHFYSNGSRVEAHRNGWDEQANCKFHGGLCASCKWAFALCSTLHLISQAFQPESYRGTPVARSSHTIRNR